MTNQQRHHLHNRYHIHHDEGAKPTRGTSYNTFNQPVSNEQRQGRDSPVFDYQQPFLSMYRSLDLVKGDSRSQNGGEKVKK
jgi:hypothetical protein